MRPAPLLSLFLLLAGSSLTGSSAAGNLNAPAAPADAGSAMYDLSSLCVRLATGAPGAPHSTVFVEPAAGPGPTPCTLNEIMAWMPAVDASGAAPAEVRSGKTFWGLTGGAWGLRTGTIPAGASVTGANGQGVIPIPDGIYAGGKTVTASDSDLTAGNIKVGANLFGVTGAYTGTYSSLAAPFPVAKTGDDDDGAEGVAWPDPRFKDNNNGTITDNLTGLVWLKNANCAGTMNWATARTWAAALVSGNCGLTDGSVAGQWRLPTIKELRSLVHWGVFDPAVPNTAGTGKWVEGSPFTGVQSAYWSSTTYSYYTSRAWLVDLLTIGVGGAEKTTSLYVWPVRGGQ